MAVLRAAAPPNSIAWTRLIRGSYTAMTRVMEAAIERGGAVYFPLSRKLCHDFTRLADDAGRAMGFVLSECQTITDTIFTKKSWVAKGSRCENITCVERGAGKSKKSSKGNRHYDDSGCGARV